MVAPVKHLFRTRMQPETIALGIDLVVAPLLGPCWAYLDPCANCTATVGYHSHYYDIEALVWHLGLASLLATINVSSPSCARTAFAMPSATDSNSS